MSDNRNMRLLISLAILLAITAVVFFFRQRETKAAIDPLLFRVEDAGSVNHVVLESAGKKIDLLYDGTSWKLNERYNADEQLVKVLMATLLQITPKRPVATQQKDSVNNRLASVGTKVTVYTANGINKEFQAGGNAAKTEAWFRDSKSGETYLMTIPGYRVYASGIFELTESDWRDKRIFNFNWRNFRQLTVTYPKDPSSDFEFVKQKDFLGIVGLANPDSTRINNFINDVLTLTADQIVAPGSSKMFDSLASTQPAMKITVNDISKKTYTLEIFGQVKGQTKLAGRTWNNEIVVFDRKKLFPIIKKRGYFNAVNRGADRQRGR